MRQLRAQIICQARMVVYANTFAHKITRCGHHAFRIKGNHSQGQLHEWPGKQPGAAIGRRAFNKRLKIGLEPLASYENFDGLLLTNGADAMYEHHEEWHWETGESAVLKFVTVHRVENGKVTLWKDYWDMSGLTNFAPPSWLENFATADMSWIFDATGLV